MLSQIVSNTPLWVWGILLGLIALGASQLASRVTPYGRVLRVAIAMTGFSLYGCLSAFGASAWALGPWLLAAALVAAITMRSAPAEGTCYLPEQRAFEVPGSWVPLGLMMGVFVVKYAAGVMMGMHLALTQESLFAPVVSAIYGGFSGAFIGRAGRLVLLASVDSRACTVSIP